MNELLGPGGIAVVMVLFGVLALAAVLRWPEVLLAVLLTGQGFISLAFKLVGVELSRAQFTVIGSVIFLPVVLLMLLTRLFGRGRQREEPPFFGRGTLTFVLVLVALGLVLALGEAYTRAPNYGARKLREFVTFGVAPFFLTFLFLPDMKAVRRLMWWTLLMAGFFVVLAMSYSQVTFGSVFSGARIPDRTFWGPFEIPGTIELGVRVAICFQSLLVLTFMARNKIWRLIALPFLLVIVGNILSAGARTGLVAVFMLAFLTPKLIYRGRWGVSFVSGLVLALVMAAYFVFTPEQAKARFLQPLTSRTSAGIAVGERELAYTKALEMIGKSPLVGWGTGGFAMYTYGMDYEFFPHNMFLEAWAENGVAGITLLLLLWYLVIGRVYRTYYRMPLSSFGFFAVVWVSGLLANEFLMGQFHYGIAHAASMFLLISGVSLKVCALAEHQLRTTDKTAPVVGPALAPAALAAGRV